MDFQVRISEAALTDFEEILAYSWANFPNTSERFGIALLNHLNLLKTFPFIGSPIAGRDGVRQLVHTPILIYYRVDESRELVEILHFWHGSRRRE
ncbi:MAG: type II toxin-antitoxin system RelE/ParE family toxin [Bryobacteraceae bacterium]